MYRKKQILWLATLAICCGECYWPNKDLQYCFVGDWKGVMMIELNYFLLTTNNNVWIWSLVCFGVAIVALLLILCFRRFPRMETMGRKVYASIALIVLIVAGCMFLYLGVSTIRKYRRILKDGIRTMGVVERTEKSGEDYRFVVVFTDERGVQHEGRTISRRKNHFADQQVPVIYYRPDPDLVIVDPSWKTFFGPWSAVIGGLFMLIFVSVIILHRVKRPLYGEQEESQQDPKIQRERAEELQFRIACKNALADGKVTVNEKQKLKMLAKYFKIPKPAIKEIIKEEVKIFKQNRKAQ